MNSTSAESHTGRARLKLPTLLKPKKQTFSRRHQRHDCVVIGTMKVVEIGAEFDGALLELSRGGCTFRQASMYVLDRIGESVLIHTEFFEAEGRIRAVRADGYGVQFFNELEEDVVDRALKQYGYKVSESFLAKRN